MLQVYYILEGFTSMMSIQSGHPMFKGRDLDLEAWSKALLEPSSFPPCPPHRSSLNVFYKQMFVWGKYYEQRTKTPKILSNRHEKKPTWTQKQKSRNVILSGWVRIQALLTRTEPWWHYEPPQIKYLFALHPKDEPLWGNQRKPCTSSEQPTVRHMYAHTHAESH